MSALGAAAADYLRFRRALGVQLAAPGRLLADYVAYLDTHDQHTLTVQTAVDWASAPPGATPAQIGVRLSVARGFARYLAAFDPATQIPPARLLHAPTRRRTPFVFTDDQVAALMAAATRLSPPLRAASMHTLIGLMAATGLRTSEARALDRDDVDLAAATLVVRCSKFGKTRQIPLHPSTATALADYLTRRDQLLPHPRDPSLLITSTGRRLHDLADTFRPLLATAGITAAPGRRPPRLHDLRHTFAVATLRDWHTAGLDVQRQLPALSTYLGHVNPAHTYWYLQAVPELMAVLTDRLEDSLGAPR